MPSIKVLKSSSLTAKECFDRVTRMLESDKDLHKLDPEIRCEFDPQTMAGKATGSQFKARMSIKTMAAGAEVTIDVDLPFHLGLVKGMVQKTLEKKLDQLLA